MPARFAPFLSGLILSGVMSFFVSCVATYRAMGDVDGFFGLWISAWIPSWCVAFPTVMIAGPVVRRFVARVTKTG